jgi:hypothetical protein
MRQTAFENDLSDRTESPDPPPQPIIIRQRAPGPQQSIVQGGPPPPPVVLPRQGFEVRTGPMREEEKYYYRRDIREISPPRINREEDFAMERYDYGDARYQGSDSYGYSSDNDYVGRRRVVRQHSRSGSPRHTRHLADGTIIGASAATLLAHHREMRGNGPEHRGRKVVGGAALGALGAEVITRARSRNRERERSPSLPRISPPNNNRPDEYASKSFPCHKQQASFAFVCLTISKDNTSGEHARKSELLAGLGKRLQRRAFETDDGFEDLTAAVD